MRLPGGVTGISISGIILLLTSLAVMPASGVSGIQNGVLPLTWK